MVEADRSFAAVVVAAAAAAAVAVGAFVVFVKMEIVAAYCCKSYYHYLPHSSGPGEATGADL